MTGTIKIAMIVVGVLGPSCSDACSATSQPASQPSTRPAQDPNALARVVALLQDPSAAVRSNAAPLGELVAVLEDPNPAVRSSAAAALGERDDVRALPPLIRLAATESDPNVLRSVATALAVIGAARGNNELRDHLVSKLMRPVPDNWQAQAEARDTISLFCGVGDISIHINWRCFPETALKTPVKLADMAGRPTIGAFAALILAMKPKEDPVLLLTPAINIISLQEATAWHQKDRQLRIIRESRRKLASASEKGRDTLKRLEARIQGIPDDQSLAKFITKVADLSKLRITVDWEDLKKHGYDDEAACEFPAQKFTVGDCMDYIEFLDNDNGTKRGLSFLVEPDGSVTIATLDTIAKRLAARAGGK